MIILSVNLNKLCLLRNSRATGSPNIEKFAAVCLDEGAGGLTLHPRPDSRHAIEKDIEMAAKLCQRYDAELNIEGNPLAESNVGYAGLMTLCERYQPAQCTMVPDDDGQLTSDHGWPLMNQTQIAQTMDLLQPYIEQLRAQSIRSAVFVDPQVQSSNAAELGVDAIEIYTQQWANAMTNNAVTAKRDWLDLCATANAAKARNLRINAGHDLNLKSLSVIRDLPGLVEVSIGHELTIDALYNGWRQTVCQYLHMLAD